MNEILIILFILREPCVFSSPTNRGRFQSCTHDKSYVTFLCTCQQTMIATAYKMFEERLKRASKTILHCLVKDWKSISIMYIKFTKAWPLHTEVDKLYIFFFEEQVDKCSDYKIITLPNFSFITYVRVYYL